MRIFYNIRFRGSRGEVIKKALIDTGASISMIPLSIAKSIGVRKTGDKMNVIGVHDQSRLLPIGALTVYFPGLNDAGVKLALVVSNSERYPIIGMDVLSPLGIVIDTDTKKLKLKEENTVGAKDVLAVIGGAALFVGGTMLVASILDDVFEEEDDE